MSTNRKSNSNLPSSTSAYKSCYRLYAGHGNWINLSEKTTQDLLAIFQKGEPCRYQLAPGLFLSIIPNDVDCNSKNIDMIGLMRADLVYDSHLDENHAQQTLSQYVRSLLDEQGIIDAFPPVRPGQDLPTITSLSTHRHLSLVPSMVGSVRRGPKPHGHSSNAQYDSNSKGSTTSSSASSFRGGTDEDNVILSSSNSSLTQSSYSSFTNNRKRNNISFRKVMKKPRLDTIYSMDTFQRKPMSPMELSTPLADTPYSSCLPAPLQSASINTIPLTGHQHHPYYSSHNNSESNSSNNSTIVMPSYQQQQLPSNTHNHHYFSSQPQTPPQSMLQNPSLWLSGAYQQNLSSSSNINTILPTLSRPSNAATSNEFNMNFSVEFDHRQSPTDILNEYDNSFSSQMNSSSFDAEITANNDLYSSSSSSIKHPSTSAQTLLHHHSHFRPPYPPTDPQQQHQDQQQQPLAHTTSTTSSDTNSLENLLPETTSIALQWPADTNRNTHTNTNKLMTTAVVRHENKLLSHDQPPSSAQPEESVNPWHHSLNNYIHSNKLNKRTEEHNGRKDSIATVDLEDVEVLTAPSPATKEKTSLIAQLQMGQNTVKRKENY